MESNSDGAGQQPVDEQSGGPLSGMSEQNVNMPENDNEMDSVIYADLGMDGQTDSMNRGSDEATDTLLYTDNSTARNVTEGLPNDEDMDDMPTDLLGGDLLDDELDPEITDLAEDEEEGGEPY